MRIQNKNWEKKELIKIRNEVVFLWTHVVVETSTAYDAIWVINLRSGCWSFLWKLHCWKKKRTEDRTKTALCRIWLHFSEKSIFSQWKFHHFHCLWHLLSALKILHFLFALFFIIFSSLRLFFSIHHTLYPIGRVVLKKCQTTKRKIKTRCEAFRIPSTSQQEEQQRKNK